MKIRLKPKEIDDIMSSNELEMKKQHKDDNFLLYVPHRKIEHWEVKKGKVVLYFHHDKVAEKFLRWLVKKPTVTDMTLDNLGSCVWKNIDGVNTINDISKILINEFGSSCEPVNDRLIMYIRYLNKRGWIRFERGNQK